MSNKLESSEMEESEIQLAVERDKSRALEVALRCVLMYY